MLRGLWRLTWLEIKIFVREPLGVLGTVGVPVVIFVLFSRLVASRVRPGSSAVPPVFAADLPILASILIAVSALLSLVTIIAIYRENGILKRLRATPLRPYTILTAHVLAKLVFTAATFALLLLAGRRFYPAGADVPVLSFAMALLFSTVCIISLGFVIASVVPTARFAQPVGAMLVYPMLGVSGLFVPVESLPPLVEDIARLLPFTYAVSLLRGIWHGAGWAAHAGDVAALAMMFAVFTVVSTWAFRWE